jgi:V/A-type H+/Na+-transporting ATPase subunit C
MLKARDAKSISDQLMRSDYASLLEKSSNTDHLSAQSLARVFYSLLVLRCYRLVRIAPEKGERFLEAYLERFLIEDVKRILRAKHSGETVDEYSLISIPKGYDYVNLQSMSAAPSLQEAIDLLKNTRFRAVEEVMPQYRKYGLISLIEATLDKIYFNSEVGPALDDVLDQSVVEEMTALEVDLTIIKSLIDLRVRGVPADIVQSIGFLPMKLRRSELALILEASPDSVPEALSRTRYANLAQPVKDALNSEKDESLDSAFRSEIYRQTKSLMAQHAGTFAYVLGYIRAAEAEANNLVSIVTSEELDLSESKTEVNLCL